MVHFAYNASNNLDRLWNAEKAADVSLVEEMYLRESMIVRKKKE